MAEIFKHLIKSVSADQMGEAIARALTELTGQEYKASIQAIDYEPYSDPDKNDAADIKLRITAANTD